ncbi:aspartate aminotransferase family protein [Streptomyces sulfonofaciens]|uniref:4-aminobutyrate aminotransferase n=1 Tax=Streptomyces sulfonofaciens TaxID=68272 RepID=A0A919L793_9ACTN|nr:4-aminobutyrate--2-oxoglutarate transaminase [Streptomyces sulfonofaciens]GHH86547.1 aspartate aminotransferase family protein [Streptomyces sulfonofaciens]
MTALPQERRVVTAIPGPKSQELQARRTAVVAAGVNSVMPVFAARAGGGIIEDVDGNRLIDFGAGIAVTSVGVSAEAVVRRATAQLADFTHTCFMVTPYEGYVEVAERLAELTPGDHPKKSVLFNSGAEAVENAVKIARSYTKRQAVVVLDHAFHGRTNLTMALTAKNMPYKDGFGPFAPEVYRVPVAYPYRWPTGPENCGPEAAAQAIDEITKQIGPENVAAIIVEPLLGEGGFIEPGKGFLPALRDFATQHGIVFVADEIQSGFCRTGRWFACEDEGIVPDLITTAKGIAGGLPLAAVTGRAEIVDAAHSGGLGGTYGGNPVACAGALGAIETMKELDLPARARRIEEVMKPRLTALQEKYDVIGDVRGRGAMLAIELVKDRTTKEPAPEATTALAKACHAAGLVVLTTGTYGNVMRFLPPLVIPENLLNEGLDILEQAFAEL